MVVSHQSDAQQVLLVQHLLLFLLSGFLLERRRGRACQISGFRFVKLGRLVQEVQLLTLRKTAVLLGVLFEELRFAQTGLGPEARAQEVQGAG